MKRLIIINKTQYGYHTDTYKYTQYLEGYNIKYVCFDIGKKRVKHDNVEVNYVFWQGKKGRDAYNFFKSIYKELRECEQGDIVFVVNFQLCFLVTFFNSTLNYILDIRTLAVTETKLKRVYLDFLTKLNTLLFEEISVISKGIAERLKLKDFSLLPLGSDIISRTNKKFDIPILLYVGTLNNRGIYKAVKGYCNFIARHDHFSEESEFHIVGEGYENEVKKLKRTIKKYDRHSNVIYHGYKTHKEIQSLFDNCNIGLSYIPQEDYFDYQPSTKTFEYLLSGLVCLATNTSAHKEIINEKNGVLCKDNSESINSSIEEILDRKEQFNSDCIRNTVKDYTWENIVSEYFEKLILKKTQ